jgi:hypothetical protein
LAVHFRFETAAADFFQKVTFFFAVLASAVGTGGGVVGSAGRRSF